MFPRPWRFDMDTPDELRNALAGFGPTANHWKHAQTPWLTYTDGLKHFAEHAGCGGFWFIDLIAKSVRVLAQHERRLKLTLTVAAGRAVVTATNARTDAPQMRPLRVPRTDCPLGTWEFWLVDSVLMLPSECPDEPE